MRSLGLLLVALTALACPGLAGAGLPEPHANPTTTPAAVWVTCQRISAVHDGDTLTCTPMGAAPFVVRVAGIDAPERGQAYWKSARNALQQGARAGTQAACYKADRYDRQVCRLRTPDGDDLPLTLVRQGLAWHTQAYQAEQAPEERARYAEAQAQARQAHRGLWRQPQPQAPWDCRRLRRQHQTCR